MSEETQKNTNKDYLLVIMRLIDLIVLGIQLAPNIRTAYEEASERLKTMIAEGRDPTGDELSNLIEMISNNSELIQS